MGNAKNSKKVRSDNIQALNCILDIRYTNRKSTNGNVQKRLPTNKAAILIFYEKTLKIIVTVKTTMISMAKYKKNRFGFSKFLFIE